MSRDQKRDSPEARTRAMCRDRGRQSCAGRMPEATRCQHMIQVGMGMYGLPVGEMYSSLAQIMDFVMI